MVSIRAMSGMVGAKSAPNAAGRAERSGHGPRESFLYDADAGGGRIGSVASISRILLSAQQRPA